MSQYADPEYRIRWPREVLRTEAERILNTSMPHAPELLLHDAFVFGSEVIAAHGNDPLSALQAVVPHIDSLLHDRDHRPYWSERNRQAETATLDFEDAKTRYVEIVESLMTRGYLARAFPEPCVDACEWTTVNESLELSTRIGYPDLWPLRGSKPRWTIDMFLDVVEVIHDLIARPAAAYQYHSWDNCGWHYSAYSSLSGQAVYRDEVNRLLEQTDFAVRLADSGEDQGRLVRVSRDDRDELVARAVATESRDSETIRHAIALFRSRSAGREEKRSAIVALAGVLEASRKRLASHLLSRDESALFEIANRFDLRHRNESQRTEYREVFLDWIFWWYLATIELLAHLPKDD